MSYITIVSLKHQNLLDERTDKLINGYTCARYGHSMASITRNFSKAFQLL